MAEDVLEVSVEEWVEEWERGATAKAAKWKRRAKKAAGIALKNAIAAEDVWAEKMRRAIDERRRAKALEKVSPSELAAAIDAVSEGEFAGAIRRRRAKYEKRIREIHELVMYIKRRIAMMPKDSPEARENRMLAAKRCMEVVGAFRKGVLTLEEARARIDEITGAR